MLIKKKSSGSFFCSIKKQLVLKKNVAFLCNVDIFNFSKLYLNPVYTTYKYTYVIFTLQYSV